MKIYIASDHGGFELKLKLIEEVRGLGFEVEDLGPAEMIPEDDYPVYAFKVAEKVSEEIPDQIRNDGTVGVLICRSGNGMAIAANKVKGIRAALCFSIEHARKAREHDDANILVLDADYAGDEPIKIIETFLNSSFQDGRHERRIAMITQYEQDHS